MCRSFEHIHDIRSFNINVDWILNGWIISVHNLNDELITNFRLLAKYLHIWMYTCVHVSHIYYKIFIFFLIWISDFWNKLLQGSKLLISIYKSMSMHTYQNRMIMFKTFGLKPYRTSGSNKIYTQLQVVEFYSSIISQISLLNINYDYSSENNT